MKIKNQRWIRTVSGYAGRNGYILRLPKDHASGMKFAFYTYTEIYGDHAPVDPITSNMVSELKEYGDKLAIVNNEPEESAPIYLTVVSHGCS